MNVNPVFTINDENIENNNANSTLGTENVSSNSTEEISKKRKKEKWYFKLIQIVIPFLIAGFGMVGAGILFSYVSKWRVFVEVNEIIVLVPALLGLKGNLDMSLASRLSTQVNLGEIHDKKTITQAVLGNVALKLLQSIVVGLLSSFVTCLTQYILEQTFVPERLLIIIASSVTSAAITSVILGLFNMFVVILSHKVKINPDNVATPMGGSIGDVGTLITLALVASFFYNYREQYWIHIIFIGFFILISPFLIIYSKRNKFVNSTLRQGWFPVIAAMFISSISGIVLQEAINGYNGIESYQPVINGVGGNLVSIYSSRLSTEISRDLSSFGTWAKWAPKKFYTYFFHTFCGKKNPESKTGVLLIALIIPGHLIFFFIIYFISDYFGDLQPDLTIWFVLFYLMAAVVQVLLLFFICYFIVHFVWRFKCSPDDYCIPLLTAFGDIFGALLLYLCFYLVFLTGNEKAKVQIDLSSNATNGTGLLLF